MARRLRTHTAADDTDVADAVVEVEAAGARVAGLASRRGLGRRVLGSAFAFALILLVVRRLWLIVWLPLVLWLDLSLLSLSWRSNIAGRVLSVM